MDTLRLLRGGHCVFSGDRQYVVSNLAVQTRIHSADGLWIYERRRSSDRKLFSGGTAVAMSSGLLYRASALSGGRLYVKSGGSATDTRAKADTLLTLSACAVLAGRTALSGARATEGTAEGRTVLASEAVLSACGAADMSNLHLDARGTTLVFADAGNKLGSVLLDGGASVHVRIGDMEAGRRAVLLVEVASGAQAVNTRSQPRRRRYRASIGSSPGSRRSRTPSGSFPRAESPCKRCTVARLSPSATWTGG